MGKLPPVRRTLSGEIRKDRENARASRNGSPFFGTGVHPNGNQGLDSDNYVPGVSGFSLNGGTGVAEFKDVVLYDVPNSMLASPVVPYVAHGEASDFTVSTDLAAKATVTIPVPAGYTRAMVSAVSSASAFNPTATSDYIYVATWIQNDATIGYAIPSNCPANDSGATTQAASALLTGISGSFTIKAAVASGFNAYTTSTGGNVCNVDATVLFLR